MSKNELSHFKALTFDTIGTLVDFEAGVLEWCRPRLPNGTTDNQILESFARVEKQMHVSLRLNALRWRSVPPPSAPTRMKRTHLYHADSLPPSLLFTNVSRRLARHSQRIWSRSKSR